MGVDGSRELLGIADELYALPLPDFTPARDAKAKELKGTDLAKDVKALKKPSLAAWVVNLLVRHETEQVEQVLEVGAALRAAQESMSGDELRQLTRQRRQLTNALAGTAREQRLGHASRAPVELGVGEGLLGDGQGRVVRPLPDDLAEQLRERRRLAHVRSG